LGFTKNKTDMKNILTLINLINLTIITIIVLGISHVITPETMITSLIISLIISIIITSIILIINIIQLNKINSKTNYQPKNK